MGSSAVVTSREAGSPSHARANSSTKATLTLDVAAVVEPAHLAMLAHSSMGQCPHLAGGATVSQATGALIR
jgi:hypothetical protein